MAINILIFIATGIALIAIAEKMSLITEIHKLFKFIKREIKILLITLFIGAPIVWATISLFILICQR